MVVESLRVQEHAHIQEVVARLVKNCAASLSFIALLHTKKSTITLDCTLATR